MGMGMGMGMAINEVNFLAVQSNRHIVFIHCNGNDFTAIPT